MWKRAATSRELFQILSPLFEEGRKEGGERGEKTGGTALSLLSCQFSLLLRRLLEKREERSGERLISAILFLRSWEEGVGKRGVESTVSSIVRMPMAKEECKREVTAMAPST